MADTEKLRKLVEEQVAVWTSDPVKATHVISAAARARRKALEGDDEAEHQAQSDLALITRMAEGDPMGTEKQNADAVRNVVIWLFEEHLTELDVDAST